MIVKMKSRKKLILIFPIIGYLFSSSALYARNAAFLSCDVDIHLEKIDTSVKDEKHFYVEYDRSELYEYTEQTGEYEFVCGVGSQEEEGVERLCFFQENSIYFSRIISIDVKNKGSALIYYSYSGEINRSTGKIVGNSQNKFMTSDGTFSESLDVFHGSCQKGVDKRLRLKKF